MVLYNSVYRHNLETLNLRVEMSAKTFLWSEVEPNWTIKLGGQSLTISHLFQTLGHSSEVSG